MSRKEHGRKRIWLSAAVAAVLAATGVVVGSETAGADAVSGGGDYISLTTGTRVMDTRDPVVGVPKAGKLQKETPTTIQVTGVGSVPATGVTAVMATVSVLGPTEGMVLRIWPSDGTKSADSVIHSLAANANLSTTSAFRSARTAGSRSRTAPVKST